MKSFKEISLAKQRPTPTISARFPNGEIVKLIYKSNERKTQLVVWHESAWKTVDHFDLDGQRFVPYSANNNLIRHNVILLPSEPQEYGSPEKLYTEIQAFLHQYIDVSPVFKEIAA